MPTEVNEAGYQTIRQHITSSWDYIELRDDTDSQVTRIPISDDSRTTWTTTASDQTQILEIEVSGSDSDIPTSTTLTGSVLYDTDSGGSALHEDTFPEATISNDSDTVIIEHSIEVPQV